MGSSKRAPIGRENSIPASALRTVIRRHGKTGIHAGNMKVAAAGAHLRFCQDVCERNYASVSAESP